MAVQVEAMPKKPDDAKSPPGQAAKIHLDVLKMARAIVAIKGGSVTDLISDTCRPIFARTVAEMQRAGEFIPKKDKSQ